MALAGIVHAFANLVSRAVFVVDHNRSVALIGIHAIDAAGDRQKGIQRVAEFFFRPCGPTECKLVIFDEPAKMPH